MPARRIEPTDLIEISFVPILIYGPPGSWKTSLGQTADNPVTLDFDHGIHRASNRREAYQFDSWDEVLKEGKDGTFRPFQSIVLDTGGRALDLIEREVIENSPTKNPWQYHGRLSPTGYGELGSRFRSWLNTVRGWKKDLVMLCHEAEKGSDEERECSPDLQGGMAWKEIHKSFDIIGRIRYDGNKRMLDFSPREGAKACKNGANWPAMELPDLREDTTFLARLIKDAKEKIGKTAEASAFLARSIDAWQAFFDTEPEAAAITERIRSAEHFVDLPQAAKGQVWRLILDTTKARGIKWNAADRVFVDPEPKADPADQPGDAQE